MKMLVTVIALASLLIPLSLLAQEKGVAKGKDASKPAPVQQVNVSGTWETQNEGFYPRMRQTGNMVTGKTYKGPPTFVRGGWSQDHLVLVINWKPEDPAKCERTIFVGEKKKTATRLEGGWFRNGAIVFDALNRVSADIGEPVTYPYAAELRACGDLTTYELAFDVGSAALNDPSALILTAVAELLKQDQALKLRVIGHTDSTGNAAKNKELSLQRAESVKKRLVELATLDAARIATEGMGQEQPIADNASAAGRALNRRVEIAIAR